MKTETLHAFSASEIALITERPTSALNSADSWVRATFRFILNEEASRSLPYFELNDPKKAKATIGYGFNIESVNQNLFYALWEMGIINSNTTKVKTQQLLQQFHNAIVEVKTNYTGLINRGTHPVFLGKKL